MILTGAGEKAFIAGADIGELAQITPVEPERSSTSTAVLKTLLGIGLWCGAGNNQPRFSELSNI